jgi:hypothetical protein
MTFRIGDKVRLKPGQNDEDKVLACLSYGTVYTVQARPSSTHVGLAEDEREYWLSSRFELVQAPVVPKRGDEVEVVIRGRVAAVQPVNQRTIIYFEETDGWYVPPVYLNAVQSLTIVEPAKPKLDLDALPEGAIVEGLVDPPLGTSLVYRKRRSGLCFEWQGMDGQVHSASDLRSRHTKLVELVRKETA